MHTYKYICLYSRGHTMYICTQTVPETLLSGRSRNRPRCERESDWHLRATTKLQATCDYLDLYFLHVYHEHKLMYVIITNHGNLQH